MRKSKDALKILDRVTGDDAQVRRAIAEERLNLQIAQMLHAKRMAAGLTQSELAKLVGTTQSLIARLEDADYAGHSLKMLQRISTALNRRLEIHFVPLRARRKTA